MSKIATITLTYPHPDKDSDRTDLYRVEKITDSMRHAPLALLTRSEVEWLTGSKNYKVTILPSPLAVQAKGPNS